MFYFLFVNILFSCLILFFFLISFRRYSVISNISLFRYFVPVIVDFPLRAVEHWNPALSILIYIPHSLILQFLISFSFRGPASFVSFFFSPLAFRRGVGGEAFLSLPLKGVGGPLFPH